MSFWRRFKELAAERSAFCCGVDPSPSLLESWRLPVDERGLRAFCDRIIDAAADQVAVMKMQSAFFERFGPPGTVELKRAIRRTQERGALAILDGKRGDIGSSMTAYAEAHLGSSSAFGADALTVTAYMGAGTLETTVRRAYAEGAQIFVVVLSSNPEGGELQNALREDGRTVAEELADSIRAWNDESDDEVGPVGAVVGATLGEPARSVIDRLPNALMLAPGIGAQGAAINELGNLFGSSLSHVIPTSSRGVLRSGPDITALREAIEAQKTLARELLPH